jgi:sRNA-binding regulator protein Hfq
MKIELSIEQRRIVLQGLWKEQDMYVKMLEDTTDELVTKHFISSINAITDLENKILGR